MNKKEYFKEYIMFFVSYTLWFYILLYRKISFGSSDFISVCILVAIGIVFLLNNILFLPKDGLRIQAGILNIFGVYTLIAYRVLREELCTKIVLSIIICSLLYIVIIMFKAKSKKENKLKWFLSRANIGINLIIAVNVIILMGNVVICRHMNNESLVCGTMEATTSEKVSSDQYKDNDKFRKMLESDKMWYESSLTERLDLLQLLANIERYQLDISHELRVVVIDLEDEYAGRYDSKNKIIYIDVEDLIYASKWEMFESICHESHHGYQYEIIEKNQNNELDDPEVIDKANCYKKEFADYKNGDDDEKLYYNQQCEIDARDYADKRVKEIQNEILH